jgi:hypothetical protein
MARYACRGISSMPEKQIPRLRRGMTEGQGA